MSNRCRELAHRRQPCHACEIRLRVAQRLLPPLALGQIQHEGHALVSLFVARGRAEQHRHTAPILAQQLLLVRLQAPGHLQLLNVPCAAVAPFRRRQVRPAHATGDEILTVVPHHAEKRVIGLDNPTVELPEVDPDDVGVDQTPDLGFPLFDIAVQTSVFQRDSSARREGARR